MKPAIEISQLSKKFAEQTVLDNLSFSIPQGSVVGILGSNGAGKTTLLQTIVGLLRANGGICQVFDDESPELSAITKHKIGYVSQESELLPWMKVRQLVEYTKSFYKTWDDELVEQLLADWEVENNKIIEQLSVGQKQKLAIILAVAHSPELLILDEPVASLDPVTRRKFIKELIDMNIDKGNTIVFSTHITSDLERVAADILIIKDGKNYYYGEIDELKERFVKLYIKSNKTLPNNFEVAGMIRCQKIGGHTAIVVEDINQVDIDKIKNDYEADITIEQLSLEDIFVEVHS